MNETWDTPFERHPTPDEQERREGMFRFAASTEASWEHPERNEDAFFVLEERGVLGVFDGLGGHAKGEMASQLAKEFFQQRLKELPERPSAEVVTEALRQAFVGADRKLVRASDVTTDSWGMGTTASLAVLLPPQHGRTMAIVGSTADSRVWKQGRDGTLRQLTVDNVTAATPAAVVERKRIEQEALNSRARRAELSPVEQALFARRNVVTAPLGSGEVNPVIFTIEILPGERLLATTDGVHDNLTQREMEEVFRGTAGCREAVATLIAAAKERSKSPHDRAKPDDLTAVMVEWSGDP